MDSQGLARVEKLCSILYGNQPATQQERVEAHKTLLMLQSSAAFLPQMRYLLDQSSTEYTLVFASRSLLQIVTRDWRNITPEQRHELVQYLMRKLASIRDPESFITLSLIQVVCRVTKLCWCTDKNSRNLFNDVMQFLQAGGPHAVLGLRLLAEIVTEFDQGQNGVNVRIDSRARMSAQSFREQDGLTKAFHLALDSVQQSHNSNDRMILREALHALHACLVYDFVGTGQDDSDDAVSCLYIPMEWAEHVARARSIHMFFNIYQAQWRGQNEGAIDGSENGAASMCLQCISLLVAVRRSVFDSASRQEFLVALLEGTTVLMRDKTGLSHSEACLHHLCRLLARIKNHFQLVDLTRPPQYQPWLQEFAKFTQEVLQSWRSISTRSVHYLMRLWGSLVLPTPYLQVRDGYRVVPASNGMGNDGMNNSTTQEAPWYLTGLDTYVPNVVHAFVATRADMCSAAALDALEEDEEDKLDDLEDVSGFGKFGDGMGGLEDDPLDDEGMLLEQLAPLSVLARYRYGQFAHNVGSLFNQAMAKREQALVAMTNAQQAGGSINAINQAKRELTDSQARLAFLTYVVGAVVGSHVSRVSASVIDRLDELNAELAALVFRMVIGTQNAEDAFANQGQSTAVMLFGFRSDAAWKLELASLYFFRCFQNLYIESRARDDADRFQRTKRALGLVEDANGFLNLTWTRRSSMTNSTSGASNGDDRKQSSSSSSTSNNKAGVLVSPKTDSSLNNNNSTAPGSAGSMRVPTFRIRSLPSAVPNLETLTSTGGLLGLASVRMNDTSMSTDGDDPLDHIGGNSNKPNQDTNMNAATNSQDGTPCPSPIVVDELSEREMTEETTNRAAAMQRSISARLGVQGGDRTLLDIAMRRIFGLLQHAQQRQAMDGSQKTRANGQGHLNNVETGSSAPVVLIQRALNVLYQLSVGVTVVHAGRSYTPRLMSSGRLLLESEVIQDLLRNPSAQRFPLLLEPKHGRARTFLMATLSKLMFTQIRYPQSSDVYGSGGNGHSQYQLTKSGQTGSSNGGSQSGDYQKTSVELAEERFILFVQPLTETMDGFLNVMRNGGNLNQEEFKIPLIGLCRDLRGLITSANVSREYELVFAWLTPNRIKVLTAAVLAWYNNTDVMVPLLKLLSEIVYNRTSRIVFPPLSVGGLVLFRQSAAVLIGYCNSMLNQINLMKEKQKQQAMEQRNQITRNNEATIKDLSMITGAALGGDGNSDAFLSMAALREAVMAMDEEIMGSDDSNGTGKSKRGAIELAPGAVGPGITLDLETKQIKCAHVCMTTLNRMLSGRYAQLGTFELYGDTCLVDSQRAVLEFGLVSSPTHVMSFPKMARAFVVLVNLLADKFILGIVSLPPPLFARAIACLGEAAASPSSSLHTPAATAIEYIAVFRCKAAAHAASTAPATLSILNPEHRTRSDRINPEELSQAASFFRAHDSAQPRLFGELLLLLLDKLFANNSADSTNQWTLARPIVPLILCAPQEFEQYRASFLFSQSVSREPHVRKRFDTLFGQLSPAITAPDGSTNPNPQHFEAMLRRNDAFTKDICAFARELKQADSIN